MRSDGIRVLLWMVPIAFEKAGGEHLSSRGPSMTARDDTASRICHRCVPILPVGYWWATNRRARLQFHSHARVRGRPLAQDDPSERGRTDLEARRSVRKHADEFAELESLDNGKPLAVARVADVPLAADLFRYMAGWATKIEGNTIPISVPTCPAPAFTPTRCASRSAWSGRSSRGTSRC